MGRVKSWDMDENGILARDWITKNQNSVAGADQKANVSSKKCTTAFWKMGWPLEPF